MAGRGPDQDSVRDGRSVTAAGLVDDLRALGVAPGQTLIVHASMKAIGWVEGGARTVVAALREAVGATGTTVVYAGTEENSSTSRAHLAAIAKMTEEQAAAFRARMPAFDPVNTPTRAGGRVAEALRTTEGAIRSGHPQSSLAAVGPLAAALMAGHPRDCHHGPKTPLGKLYRLDEDAPPGEFYSRGARVLLLGVGYTSCTALHLAEYLYTDEPPTREYSCVVSNGGKPEWVTYTDVVLDDSDFDLIGKFLDKNADVRFGDVGNAECRLMSMRQTVDMAIEWMRKYRSPVQLHR